jgi:hypothetical protein
MTISKNTSHIFSLIIFAVLFISCSMERKMAREFVESKPDISVLVLPLNSVFKNNLKRDNIGDTSKMTPYQVDSAALANSLFLNEISDSAFLETYINSMFKEFERLGITVYDESHLNDFLFIQTPAYILSIAQIELEEYYSLQEESEEFGDYVYHKDISLNAVSLNSWFELTRLNPKEEGHELFYVSEEISDFVDGYFSQNIFTGDVQFKYVEREMETDDIYRYCAILGKRYAGYTFDYIMNESITENFPIGKERRNYMRYNRANHTIDPAEGDRFIFLED